MKKFAGINLDRINTTNLNTLKDIRKTFIVNFQKKIEEVIKKHGCDARLENYLRQIQHERVVKHLDNYLKMKDKEYLTEAQSIHPEITILTLQKYIKIAVECAPDDWHTQGRIRADAILIDKLYKKCWVESCLALDTEADFDEVDLELLSSMSKDYMDTMEKNLMIANEKLDEIGHMTENVEDSKIMPYVLSMQIAHYLKIIHYVHNHEMENVRSNLPGFLIKVIHALDASVTKLKELPEEEIKSENGCFKGLMFSTWFGAKTKSATANTRISDFKMGA